jgi:peptide/nickel transport system ATP-binding protein
MNLHIKLENVSVKYKNFYALKDINISVKKGEKIGILGQSGSGKTTLCKIASNIEKPYEGKVELNVEQRGKLQFVFQDPTQSLNPRMKIFDIVTEPLVTNGIKNGEVLNQKFANSIKKVGLSPEVKNKYPHQISGGQKQRVAISRAIINEPEILICDEPISNLDISVSAQILNLLKDLYDELKFTMLFVSHDISSIYYLCDKTIILYRGAIMEWGETQDIINNPAHPYTTLLISSILSTENRDLKKVKIINRETNSRCLFADICYKYKKECDNYDAQPLKLNDRHYARCLYAKND